MWRDDRRRSDFTEALRRWQSIPNGDAMTTFAHRVTLRVGPPLGVWLLRVIGRTLRLDFHAGGAAFERARGGNPVIIAFWHDQQLMMPLFYQGKGAAALISRHRDGELIARIAARFGFGAVRGSTTRGGAPALRRLIELGRSGHDLIVTPDGPKGPRHVAKQGVVFLARATQMPIMPVAVAYSKKKSSQAGIVSRCRSSSAVEHSCSGIRFRSRRMRQPMYSLRSAVNCRRSWIG